MSSAAPPGPPPPPTPPARLERPRKPPPSGWWFLGPVALLVGAVVLFVGLLVWTVQDVADIDARVPVDGRPHAVTVPTGEDRMLLADPADTADTAWSRGRTPRPPCRIRDSEGREIAQRDVLGELTVTTGGREWSGLTRFDPGDGRIVVQCRPARRPPGSPPGWAVARPEVVIVPAIDVGEVVLRVTGVVLVPMTLGGIGVFWALVLAVLMLTRRSAPGGSVGA